jgi:hypothetical protein
MEKMRREYPTLFSSRPAEAYKPKPAPYDASDPDDLGIPAI